MSVGVPEAVEATEASGGQGLVDRGEGRYPGVACRDFAGVAGEQLGELVVEEACVARPAAVVDQAGDGLNIELAQSLQTLVGPIPVLSVGVVRRDGLPKNGVSQRSYPQVGNQVEIFDALGVATCLKLVKIKVANPVDGAFDPSTKLRQAALPRSGQSAGFYLSVTHPCYFSVGK